MTTSSVGIYLAGPIQGCDDAECIVWRNYVRRNWKYGPVFDPMRRDYRSSNPDPKTVVELDKVDIARSTALIALHTRVSAGTSMEIMFAHQLGKLVISVVPEGSEPVSPWIHYHSHAVVQTLPDAIATIIRMLKG